MEVRILIIFYYFLSFAGCAFVTYANKQCALNAVKSMHHSQTMEVRILMHVMAISRYAILDYLKIP